MTIGENLPQPYPLWCVEIYKHEAARIGRVVGWWVADDSAPSHDLVPVLARSSGVVTAADVVGLGASDEEPRLLFADTLGAAEYLADPHQS